MYERLLPASQLLGEGLPAGVILGRGASARSRRRLPMRLLAASLLVGFAALGWNVLPARPVAASAAADVPAGGAKLPAVARATEAVAPAVVPALVESSVHSGEASYYASKFEGRRTASGEPYRGVLLTAAHRTFPFGTRLRVTNVRNGRSVVVRVNDRGPFHPRRIVDLSRAAAAEIGIVHRGRAPVRVERLSS
jgi:rare lipoprotein A